MTIYIYIYMYVCVCMPNPSTRAGCVTRSIFNRSFTDLNSECPSPRPVDISKVKETSLPNYLPKAGRRIFGYILFRRVLALWKNTNRFIQVSRSSLRVYFLALHHDLLFTLIITNMLSLSTKGKRNNSHDSISTHDSTYLY